MSTNVRLAHVHPDLSKGHPGNDAWYVECDDHVKQNKDPFSLFSIKWRDECAKAIFHCSDKEFIDLSYGGRGPDQSNVKIQTSLAKGCFVAYRLYNRVPTIYSQAHYRGSGGFAKNEKNIG